MTGLEFRPTCNIMFADGRVEGPFASGERPFEVLFRPILGQLAAYSWAVEAIRSVFVANEVAPEGAELDRLSSGEFIAGHLLFPRFAGCVRNDWSEFFGVRESRSGSAREFVERCAHDWAFVRSEADVAFYCIDGARWIVFARDEGLLAAVRAYHAAELESRGIHMREVDSPNMPD